MPSRTAPRRPLRDSAATALGFDLDDPAGEVDQALALGRQPRSPALLDEQGAAELLLEPADVHRHGRLGLVNPLGGAGERAGVDDRQEGPQLVGVEHRNPSELVIGFLTNIR